MLPTIHVSAGTTGARFFCNALALSTDERQRYGELANALRAAVSETRERDRGLAFRIELDRMSLPLLAEWVALEGRCCPFFEFTIEVGPERNSTWLSLAGEEGVKEFIRQELALAAGQA
jgi:hypothetical protein